MRRSPASESQTNPVETPVIVPATPVSSKPSTGYLATPFSPRSADDIGLPPGETPTAADLALAARFAVVDPSTLKTPVRPSTPLQTIDRTSPREKPVARNLVDAFECEQNATDEEVLQAVDRINLNDDDDSQFSPSRSSLNP